MDDCDLFEAEPDEDKFRRGNADSLLREIAAALAADEGRKTPYSRELARRLIEKALAKYQVAANKLERQGAWVVRRMPDLEIVAVAFDETNARQQFEAVRLATGQVYMLRKEGSDETVVLTGATG